MEAPPVRLVVFDLGGVLVRICRSWSEACAAAGIDVRRGSADPEAVERRRAWVREYETGAIDCDAFFAGPAATMDGLYTEEEARRIHHAWLLGEYEGVGRVLDAIEASGGVETGLLSNTNPAHWDRLVPEFPVVARVKHRHASHRMRVAKPDPGIYAAFESLTGRRGGEILFFDDLPANVEAARGAGWRAERIDPAGGTAEQMIEHLRRAGVVRR